VNGAGRRIVRAFPHALTALRLLLAPALPLLALQGRSTEIALLLGVALASDVADGFLARRLGVASDAGAWFDVWADFAIVLAAFVGFALVQAVSWWLPSLIVLSFAVFIATANLNDRIYDPVGRAIGLLLMVAGLVICMAPDLLVADAVALAAAGAISLTIVNRTVWGFLSATARERQVGQ
jgi:CDP-diacylglycerol--glycerol-3-phosphate 3-phosphatidyltransferase/cardiolipin synthase